MKYIYICPQCKSVYRLPTPTESKACSMCNNLASFAELTDAQWDSLSATDKKNIQNGTKKSIVESLVATDTQVEIKGRLLPDGTYDPEFCALCGDQIARKLWAQLQNGRICMNCQRSTIWYPRDPSKSWPSVLKGIEDMRKSFQDKTVDDARLNMEQRRKDDSILRTFSPDKTFQDKLGHNVISFNEKENVFVIYDIKRIFSAPIHEIFHYEQLDKFEIIINQISVTSGGLGGAFVGGLLFGDIGAVVGSVSQPKMTNSAITDLKIKITLKNAYTRIVFVSFLEQQTMKSASMEYHLLIDHVEECMKTLQDAYDKVNTGTKNSRATEAGSCADEIRKFKGLLDDGIITQEEFNMKKKQLLNL